METLKERIAWKKTLEKATFAHYAQDKLVNLAARKKVGKQQFRSVLPKDKVVVGKR